MNIHSYLQQLYEQLFIFKEGKEKDSEAVYIDIFGARDGNRTRIFSLGS